MEKHATMHTRKKTGKSWSHVCHVLATHFCSFLEAENHAALMVATATPTDAAEWYMSATAVAHPRSCQLILLPFNGTGTEGDVKTAASVANW